MTGTTLTYIVAQEHINDLRREAERHRRAAEVTPPSRVRFSMRRRSAFRRARIVSV